MRDSLSSVAHLLRRQGAGLSAKLPALPKEDIYPSSTGITSHITELWKHRAKARLGY